MNTVVIPPEVLVFVASVRAQLSDLGAEEILEITDGLEADLTELVADQGIGALGDPVSYARELRAAAGLTETARGPRRTVVAAANGFLDACGERFDAVAARSPFDAAALLTWLRPLWWVLRAWIAVQLLQLVFGYNPWSGTDLIPSLDGLGLPAVAGAVLASVWLGRSTARFRERGGLAARVALLAVNLTAVIALPAVASQVDTGEQRYADGYSQGRTVGYSEGVNENQIDGEGTKAGVYVSGRWVSNIFPYDAAGNPLVGVQLYDQNGKPIDVVTATECVYDAEEMALDSGRVYYPWSDGAAQKRNVFPVPSKVSGPETPDPDPMAFQGKDRPQVGGFPFASVPKVSLPGLVTSTARTPAGAYVPGPRTGPINPIDNGC